jgi:glycosyltransferase involved in cell wall biosynthesis
VHGYRHNEPLKSVLATAIIGSALALWADRVIVNSSCVRRRFRFLGGKLRQISLGVDRSLLYAFQPPNYGSKPKRLIFPGQFRRGKNQAWLIQALADYCRQTGDREVELVLPGAGDSLNECKHLAERLNVGGLVCFPGQVSRNQIIEAYLKSQVAIIPSNYETFGSCIAEPLALGRIVLSRPVGCAEDLIVHGENGFLFSSKQELQELLIRVLPDLSRYRRVGEQARELRSKFDWDRIAGEYCEILKR